METSIRALARFTLIGWSLAGHLSAQHSGNECPIVDRGSPTDGLTTITVLEAPHSLSASGVWAGWHGMTLASHANNNDATYRMDVRWNRADQSALGSFIWAKGNFATQFHRPALPYAAQVQDVLDDAHAVRTIEIRFLANGTGTYPRNGFPNIAAVIADVVEFLTAHGPAEGVVGYYGSSASGTLGAHALAFHRMDEVLDGFVAGGGPYAGDLTAACTDPGSNLFMDDDQRAIIDGWSWKDVTGVPFCSQMAPFAEPSYECFSALGPAADVDFDEVLVAVIIGQNDGKKPWILSSATNWLYEISALEKSLDEPEATHQVLKDVAGALAVYKRIREIVDTKLAMGATSRAGQAPWELGS